MARRNNAATARAEESDNPEDVPASNIRRRPKNRAGRASGFDQPANSDRREGSATTLSNTPDGSAADRRTRLFRSTKEVVYKSPPWGNKKSKGDMSPQRNAQNAKKKPKGTPTDVDYGDRMDVNGSDQSEDAQEAESVTAGKRKRTESSDGDLDHSSSPASLRPKGKKVRVKKDGSASDASRSQPVTSHKAHRRRTAPRINVDASSSDEDRESRAAVLPPKFARKKVLADAELREEMLDDEGEGTQGRLTNRSASEEPEDHKIDAQMDLAAEAVTFTNTSSRRASAKTSGADAYALDSNDERDLAPRAVRRKAAPRICTSSDSASDNEHDVPPTSDTSEGHQQDDLSAQTFDERGEHNKAAESVPNCRDETPKQGTTMTRRERKLKEEMPVLSSSKKLQKKKSSAFSLADLDDGAKLPWLSRTDITSALRQISKKTWEITISDLNPVMAEVVRTAVQVGAVALQLGPYNLRLPDEHADNAASDASDSELQTTDEWGERVHVVKYTPFEAHGLNHYGVDALIKAAEILKLDGEYDVAHRLELGSMALYIRPLSNYVAGRLRSYRGSMKTAAIQCLLGALRLPDGPDQTRERTHEELLMLLRDVNFLYPLNPRTGKFDRSKPFSGAGIRDIIKAAFFIKKQWLNVGLSNLRHFHSSYKFARDEPEVTPTMLALAATALEAALIDMVNGSDSDFAGNRYHNAYLDHLGTALDFRQRKPQNYHKLAHDILVYASNGAVQRTATLSVVEGNSRRLRRAAIDWDAIVEPQ